MILTGRTYEMLFWAIKEIPGDSGVETREPRTPLKRRGVQASEGPHEPGQRSQGRTQNDLLYRKKSALEKLRSC